MKTATAEQLANDTDNVLAFVEEGEVVRITKDDKIIAEIIPPTTAPKTKGRPDFLARMVRNYGEDWEKRAPKINSVVRDRLSRDY
jgi:antitoxin (DNA-binding transcriptional repressor) of toxin-antitoxin stability system